MTTNTEHLGLILDDEDEFYDIEKVNSNMEKIDKGFHGLDERLNGISPESIGALPTNGGKIKSVTIEGKAKEPRTISPIVVTKNVREEGWYRIAAFNESMYTEYNDINLKIVVYSVYILESYTLNITIDGMFRVAFHETSGNGGRYVTKARCIKQKETPETIYIDIYTDIKKSGASGKILVEGDYTQKGSIREPELVTEDISTENYLIKEFRIKGSMYSSSGLYAKDTHALLGTAGEDSTVQDLIDAIADRVINKLVAKADIETGAGSTLLGKNLTANQALVSDASGKVNVSGISATELGYLSGVTKNIQTQFSEQNEKIINHVPGFSNPDDYPYGNYCGSMNVNGVQSTWVQVDCGTFIQQIKVTNIDADKNETYTRTKINSADWSDISWNRLADIKIAPIDISSYTWTSGSSTVNRIGNSVFICLGMLNVTCTQNGNLFQIPDGFRPYNWTSIPFLYKQNNKDPILYGIADISDGYIRSAVALTDAYVLINASWKV